MMNPGWLLAAALLQAGPRPEPKDGPLPPQEALRTFQLPNGFRIELVAAEPDVVDPVALAFDEEGRLYVADMRDYPHGQRPAGRIVRLEDRDGDGRMDRSTVFAEPVCLPTGVLPWKDGVLVASAPDLLHLRDTDGDGRADRREVLFTGFTKGDAAHHFNGLVYGLDNWIYVSNAAGQTIHSPAHPNRPPFCPGRNDARLKPDTGEAEPVTGHAQYANAFDAWGNRFINSQAHHIFHPVLPYAPLRRNPELPPGEVIDAISDHGVRTKLFPISRLMERFHHPGLAGISTSTCGLEIYRADAFPPEYQGSAFVCEPVHNIVHRDILVPRGVSFVARRGEADREFLASSDNWFRPVYAALGPDGALYVADFYRKIVEQPSGIPIEIQRRINLLEGDDRGRIYRIVHESAPRATRPALGRAPTRALVELLGHPNGWWRLTAQRLLVARRDPAAVEPLREATRGAPSAFARLHALWTLEGLGALDRESIRAALKDPEPGVREHGVRLAEPRLTGSRELTEEVLAAAVDPSPRVRFRVAFALGELTESPEFGERIREALAGIASRDATDRFFRTAVLSSARGWELEILSRVEAAGAIFPELAAQVGRIVGTRREPRSLTDMLTWIARAEAPDRSRRSALAALASEIPPADPALAHALERSALGPKLARWAFSLGETVRSSGRPPDERLEAAQLLALSGAVDALAGLLAPSEPPELQRAAARAFAAAGRSRELLDHWASGSAAVREEILGVLLSTPEGAGRLLDALEAGRIRPGELSASRREALRRHPDEPVRVRAARLLETEGDRARIVASLTPQVLALRGDPERGRALYMANCAKCHNRRTLTSGILYNGRGYNVAPDLGSAKGRAKEALLVDILDPNRSVEPPYLNYVIETTDGRVVSGLIASEAPHSITLRASSDEEAVVPRSKIARMKATGMSLMPEGLEKGLSLQDLADLLEFLQGD